MHLEGLTALARVEWTRQSGEDVEAVVGMLLCSRFPNAVRVRPSQGDGGIDIFVPGPAGWGKERAVWQIKRYCHNLTGTEKRAIKRSFARVVETSKKEGWRITEWHLAMPLDLTGQNLGWLDAYLSDSAAEFPCETHGLLLCDTLAGIYPKVVDYYLRDGKERLQAELDSLTAILARRTNRNEDEPLMPADVTTDLTSIYNALNACDPFYKYNLEVSDKPPPDVPPDDDGLIAVHATCQDSVWITIKIYALSLAALEERPITWRLQLAVSPEDDALRKQVEKFIDYGGPLSMPAGAVSGFLDLPGGLGGDIGGASLEVIDIAEQSEDGQEPKLAIAMLAPDSDTVIASTAIRRTELSRGQGGGIRSIWIDEAELFSIEMLAKANQQRELTWNFQTEYSLGGRRPADIVDSLKFLAAMHVPNRIGIGLPYGPKEFTSGGTAPSPEPDMDAKRWARIAEALAQIQNHVGSLLKMPAELTVDQAKGILHVEKLVSGNTATGAVSGAFTVTHQETPNVARTADKLYEFMLIRDAEINLGEEVIVVGKEMLFFLGRYLVIGDDKSVVEPKSEYASLWYTGELESGHVMARRFEGALADSGSTDADAPAPREIPKPP
ncbi:Uncharacterised protein [Mycobacteroides abscessus subsp. bolletii]|nr:Uncharacterised protein [Mycobacteroides abscessus subsp. bolletii]